jgi:ribonucleoside-diphosphate reductase alpha chain
LALSGCGFGGGLLIPFVNNLSRIEKRTKGTKTFVIQDSIEGWADSLGVLMSSYFADDQPFPEFAGYEVKFDYSQIREKGAFISGGFKAPGHEGLKQSLEKIEQLIEKWLEKEVVGLEKNELDNFI